MRDSRSNLIEAACDVQESGLCTPDWVLKNMNTDKHGSITISVRDIGFSETCRKIENQRHFLFDELPTAPARSRWPTGEAALQDYLRRMRQPSLYDRVTAGWN